MLNAHCMTQIRQRDSLQTLNKRRQKEQQDEKKKKKEKKRKERSSPSSITEESKIYKCSHYPLSRELKIPCNR